MNLLRTLKLVVWAALPRCPRKYRRWDWRCERHRWHDGPHRYRNYLWWRNGYAEYEPVPPDYAGIRT